MTSLVNELNTPSGASMCAAAVAIISVGVVYRESLAQTVLVGAAAIVGHLLSSALLPAYLSASGRHTARVTTTVSVVIVCALSCAAWSTKFVFTKGGWPLAVTTIAKRLDGLDAFYWGGALYAILEAYEMSNVTVFVSEQVQRFLRRKIRASQARNKGKVKDKSVFVLSVAFLAVCVVAYIVSIAAFLDAYRYVTCAHTSATRGHVMAIAVISALAVVITVYTYASENLGIPLAALSTLYAAFITRGAALSLESDATSITTSYITNKLNQASNFIACLFTRDKHSKASVAPLGCHAIIEVAIHGIGVLGYVMWPNPLVGKYDKSTNGIVLNAFASSSVLFGLLSAMIGSVTTHTHTDTPSAMWKYIQCGIVFLSGINLAHIN